MVPGQTYGVAGTLNPNKSVIKPVDTAIKHDLFDRYPYKDWNEARIGVVINKLGKTFFANKKVLEVGCGFGSIGSYFLSLGSIVTCSDVHNYHLEVVKQRYPEIGVIQADLDRSFPKGKFDIIIHFGTLYHLKNPESAISMACQSCDYLFLETEVCDSDDPYLCINTEDHKNYDQAYNGTGSKPSPAFIERIFRQNGFVFELCTEKSLNVAWHHYDWKSNNDKLFQWGKRRFWFAQKC